MDLGRRSVMDDKKITEDENKEPTYIVGGYEKLALGRKPRKQNGCVVSLQWLLLVCGFGEKDQGESLTRK
jgi:hypothetical protein